MAVRPTMNNAVTALNDAPRKKNLAGTVNRRLD
jgi:hypothetical protein